MDYYSDDFSTSRGDIGRNTADAWRIADSLGLSGISAKHFTQGFIHARQGRAKVDNCSFEYARGYNRAA